MTKTRITNLVITELQNYSQKNRNQAGNEKRQLTLRPTAFRLLVASYFLLVATGNPRFFINASTFGSRPRNWR